MVRMLFCNIDLIAGGAWSWREKQRNLSPEVQNFIWLLDQERKLWLSRTSTADFVPSLLPLSPSHSSETWLWDAKNPSKAQLQASAPEKTQQQTKVRRTKPELSLSSGKQSNLKKWSCAMWMTQLSGALSIAVFHCLELGDGKGWPQEHLQSCVCLSSYTELSWGGKHLLCEMHLLFSVLLLLIFLQLLWVFYSIAVSFQKIVVSTHCLCLYSLPPVWGGGKESSLFGV